jgi:hypothetical protein
MVLKALIIFRLYDWFGAQEHSVAVEAEELAGSCAGGLRLIVEA